jgi:hypothetical protein
MKRLRRPQLRKARIRGESSFAVLPHHPRIKQRNADRFEVGNVARHNRQAVNYRGCGDHSIAFRARIRDMKARAVLRHRCIDSENATFEARQQLLVDPGAEDCTLRGVPTCDSQRAQLDLKDGDGRKKEAPRRNRAGPRYNILICPLRSSEFGNDVRIEQEHHSRSAGLKMPPRRRGGLNSKSAALPGWASASARLTSPPVRRR